MPNKVGVDFIMREIDMLESLSLWGLYGKNMNLQTPILNHYFQAVNLPWELAYHMEYLRRKLFETNIKSRGW